MTHFKKMTFLTTVALAATLAGKATAAETATTSIAGTPLGGGIFQYDISVTNTSTDNSNIGTLWFAWIPGDFYMEATPTNVSNSAGWQNNIIAGGGESIQWQAGTQPVLTPGNTDQFIFDSTETLAQLEGPSTEGNKLTETTSFLYSGSTAFSGTGVEIVIPAAVPEPATLSLLALGSGGLLLRRRRMA
jgi:hypothetical protein